MNTSEAKWEELLAYEAEQLLLRWRQAGARALSARLRGDWPAAERAARDSHRWWAEYAQRTS